VLQRLAGLEDEFVAVEARLADQAVISDPKLLREASKRHSDLEPMVIAYRAYRSRLEDLASAKEFFNEAAGDEREEWRAEVSAAEADVAALEDQLKLLLLPKDPNVGKNVIIEIRGAEGGEEANLFARDLYQMYMWYATRMGWKADTMNADSSDMGGFNEVTIMLKGDSVWQRMKHEGGTHRVQRVPVTEAQGRIHTSAATVTVMPEAEEVDIVIDPNDLQIDVFRSGGPGGQSVNTTDSAVRITHKPTGVVVIMQDEKSQIQNRAKALQVLRSRLLKAEQDRQQAEMSDVRRSQVGGGGRGEKIRTYNFKENRVSDHRIGLTLYKLDKILAGELDEVVDALVANERAEQLAGNRD
jgi:peptide chain release factor 1